MKKRSVDGERAVVTHHQPPVIPDEYIELPSGAD